MFLKHVTKLSGHKCEDILSFTTSEVQDEMDLNKIHPNEFDLLYTKLYELGDSFVKLGPVYLRKDVLKCLRIKLNVVGDKVSMIAGDFGELIFHLSQVEIDSFVTELITHIPRKGQYFRIEYEEVDKVINTSTMDAGETVSTIDKSF